MELLIDLSDGDARRLLNLLELVGNSSGQSKIDSDLIKQITTMGYKYFIKSDLNPQEFVNQIKKVIS